MRWILDATLSLRVMRFAQLKFSQMGRFWTGILMKGDFAYPYGKVCTYNTDATTGLGCLYKSLVLYLIADATSRVFNN